MQLVMAAGTDNDGTLERYKDIMGMLAALKNEDAIFFSSKIINYLLQGWIELEIIRGT